MNPITNVVQLVVLLCFGASLVHSIQCVVGPDHDADLLDETDGIRTECRQGLDYCLRIDARLVNFNDSEASERPVIVGLCSSLQDCLNLPCQRVLAKYWSINYTAPVDPDYEPSGFYSGDDDLWEPSYDVRTCVTACCQTDFCNENATEVILGITPPTEVEETDDRIEPTQLPETTTGGCSSIGIANILSVLVAFFSIMMTLQAL